MSDQTILITRPASGGEALAAMLHERGFRTIHEPLLHVLLLHDRRQALQHALLGEPDAVIVTSRHGVQALALLTDVRDQMLVCVGDATAEAAQSQGFARTVTAGGSAQRLIEHITAGYDAGTRFLYASGTQASTDIITPLQAAGMEVQRLPLYEAAAANQLSDTVAEQLKRGHIDAVTLMSPRTADIFMRLVAASAADGALQHMQAFCLSDAVAAMLGGRQWRRVHTARQATLASLVECIDNALADPGTIDHG